MDKFRGESLRERNYNAGTLYAGSLSNLIKYGPSPGQRAVVDTHGCTLSLAMNILMFIADTVMLYHSPCGCLDDPNSVGMIINKLRAMESQNPFQWEMRNIHTCTTNMHEKTVIHGGEEKLARAIRIAKKRYNPRLIAVLVSCTSAIIGDDVEVVCKEAEKEFDDGTYCIPIHAQGYQTHTWLNYSDCIWVPIVERIMQPPSEIDENMVNFFRPSNTSNADIAEAERLLSAMGLMINVLPDLQSVESLERASESALNTGMCRGYHLPVIERMHTRFQTPYTETPYLLGIEFTTNWLLEVGEKTGRLKEAKRLIKEEKERIQSELNELRKKLSGKRVVVAASHSKTLGLIQACHDLDMEVLCAYSHFTDDSLIKGKKEIMKQVGNIDVMIGSPLYEEICRIIKEKPDVVICHGELSPLLGHLDIANKCTYLYNYQGAHLGFQGVIEVGKLMYKAIHNPLRKKIIRYYKNPTGLNWANIPFLKESDSTKYVPQTYFNVTQKCKHQRR